MATLKRSNHYRLFKRRYATFGVVFGSFVLLAGCSSVPDALNPAEWYKDTMDFFTGDDTEGQVARKSDGKDSQLKVDQGKPAPGANKPFPNLARVQKGLGADTAGRKYAESIARQGDARNVLNQEPGAKKPAPAQIASAPPAPPAPKAAPAPAVMRVPSTANSLPPVRLRPPPQMAAPTPSSMAPPSPRLQAPSRQFETLPQPQMVQPAPSITYDPFSTVTVSSKGMEMGAQALGRQQAMAAPHQQVLPSRSLAQLTGRGGAQMASPRYPSGAVMARQPVLGQGMVKIATILFPNGSSRLSTRDQQILNDVAQLQRESGGRPLVIVGHASSRTRDMNPSKHRNVNHRLSQNRANKVARALRRLGISERTIQIQAVGDTQPTYYEVMPSGEAGNRRADIFMSY